MVCCLVLLTISSNYSGGEIMRRAIKEQMEIGEVDIASIPFNYRSRDEIPKLLIGAQSVYKAKEVLKSVFEILWRIFPDKVDFNKGRKGMDLWKIFILGILRLGCNWDFDKVHEMANEHNKIRLMLTHPKHDTSVYGLNTIKDNLTLFTLEVLEDINELTVKHGHQVIKMKPGETLKGSCDSFPVLTDVHFPTDINLLWDAMRKIVTLIMVLCEEFDLNGWRKGECNLRKVKMHFRRAQNLKHSNSKSSNKKEERADLVVSAHIAYIDFALTLVERAKDTISQIQPDDDYTYKKVFEIRKYICHAERQIDQIRRRVVDGETIPHHEKVFSLFEEHTEWIVKGKAGVPVELGLNVCIVKDQYGFILHSRVMQNESDVDVAVPIIEDVQSRFSNFTECSFDKGFHSPSNQDKLGSMLDQLTLPRKGKLSAFNKAVESSDKFIRAKRKHSAVESSINALECSGLDQCRDHGIDGYKRYVPLAVVARNLQTIGDIIQKRELKREKRQRTKNYCLAA